jgi:hypothetical protein
MLVSASRPASALQETVRGRQRRRKEISPMPTRLRPFLLLLAALLATTTVAACGGGGGGDKASSGSDVNQLLEDTFSGAHKVDSGKLDLTVRIDATGSPELKGPVTLKLGGPFQTQGKGKLPTFDIDASFDGAGQSFKAGLTSTGDKGFVNFQGQEYAVSPQVFQQFKAGFEQAQKQAKQKDDNQSLATLGIDPRRWLKDPKDAGEAKVGDADTIKITGSVDVAKLLDDVNAALQKARSLGVQGTQQLPGKLTEEQKRQATEAIKALDVEIYTGKDDNTLRRMLVNLDAEDSTGASGAQSAKVTLDFSLLDLNEDQEIAAPANAKPFEQLLGSLGGLGLGGAGSSGSGSGGGSSGSAGASADDLKKYSDCIETAGSDVAEARKCADLLAP